MSKHLSDNTPTMTACKESKQTTEVELRTTNANDEQHQQSGSKVERETKQEECNEQENDSIEQHPSTSMKR